MILCVTLNPCLDKTLTVPAWRPGDSVRGDGVSQIVGGKGNNVARALWRLGQHDARPVTFLGGPIGEICDKLLREQDGFDPIIITTESATRVILTVRTHGTNEQTAFFDPDPAIQPVEAEALYHRVEEALGSGKVRGIVLSGSSPSEATHSLYSDLISLGRARKIPVFLDTYGAALGAIWGFWPEVVQLNRREASAFIRSPRVTDDQMWALVDRWGKHGVTVAVVTDGPRPAFVRWRDQRYRVHPPRIEALNPVGSGDCFLAGLVEGFLAGRDTERCLQRATACAVANALVWEAGMIDRAMVERLEQEVRVEPYPGG
jgi:1-phosphofructokinase family hexose kinase